MRGIINGGWGILFLRASLDFAVEMNEQSWARRAGKSAHSATSAWLHIYVELASGHKHKSCVA